MRECSPREGQRRLDVALLPEGRQGFEVACGIRLEELALSVPLDPLDDLGDGRRGQRRTPQDRRPGLFLCLSRGPGGPGRRSVVPTLRRGIALQLGGDVRLGFRVLGRQRADQLPPDVGVHVELRDADRAVQQPVHGRTVFG